MWSTLCAALYVVIAAMRAFPVSFETTHTLFLSRHLVYFLTVNVGPAASGQLKIFLNELSIRTVGEGKDF